MAAAKLEMRTGEGETLVETSKPEPIVVPPPPPPVVPASHIPHVLVVPLAADQCVIPSPGMPVFAQMQGGAMSIQPETARRRQLTARESSGAHESRAQ